MIDTDVALLATLEADGNLQHSGVRWAQHEKVYPGSGAAEQLTPRLRARDLNTHAELHALLGEFEAKAPDDEMIPYLRWACDLLADHLAATDNRAAT